MRESCAFPFLFSKRLNPYLFQPPNACVCYISYSDDRLRCNPLNGTASANSAAFYATGVLVGIVRCRLGGCVECEWVYYEAVQREDGGREETGVWVGE